MESEQARASSPLAPTPIGRLAPSPTGELHLGHARSFLLAYWSVRSRGGQLLLRLEDLDQGRCRDQYIDLAQRDLEWLGLDWDETWLQSRRRETITAAAMQLLKDGWAYPCVCSRTDIQNALSAPHDDARSRYPGTCRDRYQSLEQARLRGQAAGLRFRARNASYRFDDAVAGPSGFELLAPDDDFLILRRDGTPAYHLAVVVDDASYGVNLVLRGDDLLSSTPYQLALYEALGLTPPAYAHVPLVLDASGRRLAKRHGALSLRELRDRGVDPRRIVAWAAESAGFDVGAQASAAEVTRAFDWSRLNRAAVSVSDDFS